MTTLKTFDSPTFSSLSNDSVLQVYLDISEPSLSSLPGYVFLSIIYPLFRSPHDNENVNGAFLAGLWALSIQRKVRGLPRFLQVWATLRAVVLSPRSVASDLEKPLLAIWGNIMFKFIPGLKWFSETSLNIQGHLEVNVCNLVPIALFPDFRGGAHLI